MNTKITLNLKKSIVDKAKQYAASHKISLSSLVEEYFQALNQKNSSDRPLAPITKELSTLIKNHPENKSKQVIEDYLLSKYTR
jgi:hypothetical protein